MIIFFLIYMARNYFCLDPLLPRVLVPNMDEDLIHMVSSFNLAWSIWFSPYSSLFYFPNFATKHTFIYLFSLIYPKGIQLPTNQQLLIHVFLTKEPNFLPIPFSLFIMSNHISSIYVSHIPPFSLILSIVTHAMYLL